MCTRAEGIVALVLGDRSCAMRLNYNEYDLYTNLPSTFQQNNGKMRYPVAVGSDKVKPKEENNHEGISEKIDIEDVKPEIKPAAVPEVVQKINPIGKDHIG